MLAYLAFCEPVDTLNPQLWSRALYTISTGAIGMLLARRRPILSAPFIFFVSSEQMESVPFTRLDPSHPHKMSCGIGSCKP
jgi:hypothetical protein